MEGPKAGRFQSGPVPGRGEGGRLLLDECTAVDFAILEHALRIERKDDLYRLKTAPVALQHFAAGIGLRSSRCTVLHA